jgi:hypothetical protein
LTLIASKVEQQFGAPPRRILQDIPGYVPEFAPTAGMSGEALLQVFRRYMEFLRNGIRQLPERNRLAFLDSLGIGLLPAQASRAPLVFSLVANSTADVTLPAGSAVAANVPPPPPSDSSVQSSGSAQTLIFSTEQTVTLCRAQLKTVYSILPGSDEFTDHSAQLAQPFSFFDDLSQCPHAINLGHDNLFALAGDISVIVTLTLQTGAAQSLSTEWEYLTDQGWLPLTLLAEDDTTDGLQTDGQLTLRRECGPNSKQHTFQGQTSYWIRGHLTAPLLPDGTSGQRTIPVVNDISVRVQTHKGSIAPDAAFADRLTLDCSKDFLPFGEQPPQHPTFYLASKEVFQRKDAQVQIDFEMSSPGIPSSGSTLVVFWEYFDGQTWSQLPQLQSSPGTDTFTAAGSISFLSPDDWAQTSVNGTTNYWLRARVTDGDYGQPLRPNAVPVRVITSVSNNTLTLDSNDGYSIGILVAATSGNSTVNTIIVGIPAANQVTLQDKPPGSTGTLSAVSPLLPSTLHAPVVASLTLGFSYSTDPTTLDHCLVENDFAFTDETEASRWPDQTFIPFRPIADERPAIHFGFDQLLPAGLISVYIDVPQDVVGDTEGSTGSPFIWEYYSAGGWTELGVLDETLGFQQSGMVQFIGPPDAAFAPGLGGNLIWIRARLKPGEEFVPLPVGGVWLNAVWANQSMSVPQEPLGTGGGNLEQTFSIQRPPVLEGEVLEVREWQGTGEWQFDLVGVAAQDLTFDRDPVTQGITAVWVRWYSRAHFYGATPSERCFVVDRARGIVEFGAGQHGMALPAGRAVRISYQSGEAVDGQASTTVAAGAITELRMAVPMVESVVNPVAATGGADTEALDAVKMRGAESIRSGGRGVSAEDLEWLAHEATPEVARAHCLPLTGPAGYAQRGWVTLIVVPFSLDPQPQPSAETKRRIQTHLAQNVSATSFRGIRVTGPTYTLVSIRAEIVPQQPDQAATVEAAVRQRLNQFLHPLTGDTDQRGWQFGQPVRLSQIARVIEETDGVDYCAQLWLMNDGHVYDDMVPVNVDGLVAAGPHELKLTVGVR